MRCLFQLPIASWFSYLLLHRLRPIGYYLSNYTDKQSNAFATYAAAQTSNNSNPNPLYSHASRYLELYLPNGSIEIAHTSRYAHATGKSELCILATRPLAPGTVITELKGSMADLTNEEDRELKCATATGQAGIRRDFSVIHSKQLKKNHLFLGPARFVNVSRIGCLPSVSRAYATQSSMIVATTSNCFERDVTSRSELSSPSPWERR